MRGIRAQQVCIVVSRASTSNTSIFRKREKNIGVGVSVTGRHNPSLSPLALLHLQLRCFAVVARSRSHFPRLWARLRRRRRLLLPASPRYSLRESSVFSIFSVIVLWSSSTDNQWFVFYFLEGKKRVRQVMIEVDRC